MHLSDLSPLIYIHAALYNIAFRYNIEFILTVRCTTHLLSYAFLDWNNFVAKNIIYDTRRIMNKSIKYYI